MQFKYLQTYSFSLDENSYRIEAGVPVEGLGTQLRNDSIFSFADTTVDLWKLRHIHNLFTTVGSVCRCFEIITAQLDYTNISWY